MNKKIKKALEELQKNIDIIDEYVKKNAYDYRQNDEIDITLLILNIYDAIEELRDILSSPDKREVLGQKMEQIVKDRKKLSKTEFKKQLTEAIKEINNYFIN